MGRQTLRRARGFANSQVVPCMRTYKQGNPPGWLVEVY